MPAERLGLPAVTDRDREGLARALDLGVDFVAQSFVRAPNDVRNSSSWAWVSGETLSPRATTSRAVSSSSSRTAIAAAGDSCHTFGPSRASITARIGVPASP